MKSITVTFVCATSILLGAFAAPPAQTANLNLHLEPLKPLLKTWKGTFKNSTPEKPVIDISRWERALNGQGVRVLHSINNGAYGGETLIVWNQAKNQLVYYYFTTAGFMTTGTMTFDGPRMLTHEFVSGATPDGISEVRGTSEIRPDGTFLVKTEYLKKGEWTPGREVVYLEDPAATVQFK